MEDTADRFTAAIDGLQAIADELTPEEAVAGFDDATLQNFWRDWTSISQWAGALWRLLSEDLEEASTPVGEGGPEIGGSG